MKRFAMIAMLFLGCLTASVYPAAANPRDYSWENNTDQQVVLLFRYLDSSLNPNGQTNSVPIQAQGVYDTGFDLNTKALVEVRNGKALDWNPSSTIFGYGFQATGRFHIGR